MVIWQFLAIFKSLKTDIMMETKTFAVSGMKCEHCLTKVENALKSLPGVNAVEGSLADKSVTVTYDEGQVSPARMKESVAASGRYELSL